MLFTHDQYPSYLCLRKPRLVYITCVGYIGVYLYVYEFWDTNFNIMYKFWGKHIVLYAGVVSIT